MKLALHIPALLTPLALAVVLLAGCPDDTAQRRMMQWQQDLAVLQTENDSLKSQLKTTTQDRDALHEQFAQLTKVSPDEWQLVPQPTHIEIGSHSGLRPGRPELSGSPTTQPDDGTPPSQFVRLYVMVLDQEGFRIRSAARVRIGLFDLSGDQPRSLGSYQFPAAEAVDHYRSALGSECFAFDLPLSAEPPKAGVTFHVELADLLTGKTFTAEKLLALPPP